MKKRFRDSLPSEWLKYLVIAILSVVLWIWVFGVYHAPGDTETIELFFAGQVKDYSFESMAERQFDSLKEVSIAAADPSSGTVFMEKYRTVGLTHSDVVLVPESVANQTQCVTAFSEMPEIGELFVQEGVAYGVYLTEEAKMALSEYFTFTDERYVALAVAASPNSGSKTNHSFEFIEWLVR